MSRTTEINKLVSRAYTALGILDNITWTKYRKICFDLAVKEEKQHRLCKPASAPPYTAGATVAAAGRFFVVYRIAQYATGVLRMPTIKELISSQPSALYAASLVANFPKDIGEALNDAGVSAKDLAELDYVEFVEGK